MFWIGVVVGAVGMFAAWIVVMSLTLGRGGSDVSLSLGEYFRIKTQAASAKLDAGSRLFIFGGSSSFYGLSAAEIERRNGVKTINFFESNKEQ